MKYISTRGLAPALTFEEAMLTGLALDGGLYVPEYIPKVTKNQILSLQGLRYQEIAFKITKPFSIKSNLFLVLHQVAGMKHFNQD